MTRAKRILVAVAASLAAGSAWADTSTVSFNVAPGVCKIFALPANNKPIHIMGSTIVPTGSMGVAEIVIHRSAAPSGEILEWTGLGYEDGLVRGATATPGTHIVYLDIAGELDLQVAASTHIQVCNDPANRTGNEAGYLTFVY